MKNRYVDLLELDFILEEARRKFTYSPPDPARMKEHEYVNEAILTAVEAILQTCPDTRETEQAIDHLWLARACANGALATYKPQ